jgi:DNA polymerase-1
MQNIPRAKGSSEAKMARSCFIAPPGYTLLEADFSQVELRVAAMLAKDTVMIEDFRKGIDIHAENARICAKHAWKIEPHVWASMTKDERDPFRSKIKTSTFAKLYGKTIKGLAKQLNCSEQEAQYLVNQIWGRYKILDQWTKDMVREARKTGETWTWWDGQITRRRYIHGIAHPDDGIASHYERVSYNNAVQGTANEFCLASVSKITREIKEMEFDAYLAGTVHDSILSIVRDEELPQYARMKRAAMMSFNSEGVPLNVDLKTGRDWGDLHDYDPDKQEAA